MTMHAGSIVVQVENQVSVDQDGEIAVLNLETMTYFGLDAVGRVIWDAIAEPAPVEAICAAVCRHFDVGVDDCRPDVIEFLEQLDAAGLIREVAT